MDIIEGSLEVKLPTNGQMKQQMFGLLLDVQASLFVPLQLQLPSQLQLQLQPQLTTPAPAPTTYNLQPTTTTTTRLQLHYTTPHYTTLD